MIKKITIEIPSSINGITLDAYQRFFAIFDEKADQDFINKTAMSIFYGIDGKYFAKMKARDVEKTIGALNEALTQKIKLVNRFELHGKEYGLIPDFDDMTLGEFTDLDNYSEMKDLHKLMSILYRPITDKQGKRYNIEPYSGSNDKLKGMPLGIALSCQDFFFSIALQLTSATLNSLKAEGGAQTEKLISAKNGVGTLQSIPLRMVTLPSLIR
jgi:hypothetical protein